MTRPDAAARGSSTDDVPESDANSNLPQTFFLGRYRVVDEIGIGGMASVHLARVDGPGGFQKWVAIKRIHPHLVEDDQFVDMFLDEARIAAGINHANVAQVFDLGKDDNTYWIAMEYLHGEPLREVMRRIEEKQSRIAYHVTARICADAAEGLHGAHELRGRNGQLLNLVHRDVTPHNLFVTYDGYTKVVDFGIAKVVDRLASTRAGTLKGKLAYMSPEQVRGQEVDRRTDIFALGVVLWELTTNRRLFRMETDLDTLEKVQACVVPLPHTIAPDYPPELEEVVMRALAQRREDRFQTAREFSRALQRFLMKQGSFVGPEDVGDCVKGLFEDRVAKREKYLEWAAEVTSAVDLEQLQKQQQAAEEGAQSLLHAAQAPSVQRSPEPPQPEPQPSPRMQASYGQESAAAAVVTSAPVTDLASSSLMDEDDDMPTIVAQPRVLEAQSSGPRPAAGSPAGGGWEGSATQMMPESNAATGFDSTIAMPDHDQANEIRARVDQMDRQLASAGFGAAAAAGATPEPPFQAPLLPGGQVDGPQANQGAQAAIETKMSLPRPAAVAQWLMEQGDVEIHGPRSTGVIVAIAALATLCAMGVASLIVYKLRRPPSPEPVAVVPTVTAPIEVDPKDSPEAVDGDGKSTKNKDADAVKASKPAASSADSAQPEADAPKAGSLTIDCRPACDSIVAGGASLGPSPVFNHAMDPGQHRVKLKGNGKTKTIVVRITSGQLTAQTVTMK